MSDGNGGTSWLERLRRGFSRTSERLNENLTGLVGPGIELDERTLGELEEALIATDLGHAAAARIAARVGEGSCRKTLDEAGLRAIVDAEIETIHRQDETPLAITHFTPTPVVRVGGAHGSG